MNFINKISLRMRMVLVVNLIIVTFGVVIFGVFKMLSKDYEKDLYQNFFNYSENIGFYIQDQFFERYGDVQAFALNQAVRKLDKQEIQKVFDEYVSAYGLYDVILLVDKNGKFIASNTKDLNGRSIKVDVLEKLNFSQTPWFKKAINGDFTEDKSKNFFGTLFEDIHQDPIRKLAQGEEKIGTSFTSIVKNNEGEVVGVITNRSTAKWIEDAFVRTYEQLKKQGFPHTEITMLDKSGVILIEHDPYLNGGKNEVKYDLENVNFKLNLTEKNIKAAIGLVNGKEGITEELHARKKINQINGFKPISGSKFINSIGWGIIVRVEKEEILAHIDALFKIFYIAFFISILVSFVIIFFFSKQIADKLVKVSQLLGLNAESLNKTSNELTAQGTRLSESSTEQASAIQETMAAIDEISATVEKNTEAARQSKSVSSESLQASNLGKQTVANMLSSIDEISASNDSIAEQMKQNSQKINEIVRLISDIGNKTKVINEIVFQTKLLSFNASVEAARAGEYGKGFAVVAEEVGNLAQMSGNAAKEISALLEESQRKTSQIVKETESKVEELIQRSMDKVELGKKTASECNSALDEIAKNVKIVDEMVTEISRASEEQANGIKEIAKAMGQLDVTTSENSKIAQDSNASSINVNHKSEELKKQVNLLLDIVAGEGRVHEQDKLKEKLNVERSATKTSKVVPLKKKSAPSVATIREHHEKVIKKAVSGDNVPNANDPRFEEV